jgi:hypothetical protein
LAERSQEEWVFLVKSDQAKQRSRDNLGGTRQTGKAFRILAERSQTQKGRTGIWQNEAKSLMEAMAGWQNEAKNGLHAATPNA